MKRLEIDRKVKVWTRETVEYDDTKYTEEEFINQYHRVQNGYSNEELDSLYETYDYEIILDTCQDINPHDDNGATLVILNEDGEELYDNLNKVHSEVEIKTEDHEKE